ncbi:MAG: arsenosugar biosynthesis radical SAM protein ArsS [candidate division Zixibacteria bacterium]|nr:arsenosugar biosynthesis radical SAM protein ArsS [candidate division Zixibacteria bacterium]
MKIDKQLKILGQSPASFARYVENNVIHDGRLTALSLKTIQINVGKLCNQACTHCHVDASPIRTENITRETAELCLKVIAEVEDIETVDLTGGAPEMNENFTFLVEESKRMGKHVIDRCNLTILEHKEYGHLYDFLTNNQVEIVASLPHYSGALTDRQRGRGVFGRSIEALKKLNHKGYGTDLPLNLVYNPNGIYLAAPQKQLEREFKEQLQRHHGVVFSNLYTINNLPINRFLAALIRAAKYDTYMETLVNAFNPATLDGLMCRHQISVAYDGQVYDCDFNQMLDLTAQPVNHIRDFNYDSFMARRITVNNHCFGCTAGAGSSCGGEIAKPG